MALRPDLGIPNAALHSGSAVTAAMLATIITSPADCVKVSTRVAPAPQLCKSPGDRQADLQTRMQVAPAQNPNIRSALVNIYRDTGVPGFFSGSSMRISRKAASSAIAWTVYEGLLLFMGKQGKAPKETKAV